MLKGLFRFGLCAILLVFLGEARAVASEIKEPATDNQTQAVASSKPLIFKLKPERKDGQGYKLVYLVDAPMAVFWKFKTDFDNQILLSNKFIAAHRVVSRNGNQVITQDEYSNRPKAIFKWQTTVLPDRHRLKFVLLNPEECGQNYHYGSIQLEPLGTRTRVTQVAYFDFFGVSIWVSYPFYGGMTYFLNYTASWEQQTILKLKHRYEE
ncbi:hypothetical protein D1AOALGA4SA_5946 [Olavius algarvensis Delta 1 endosymbiont]|nr:hypothetical protein D1AOALGA4SA_5946 [Olavius algarvensis Delta 1 endosymbiont]